MYEPKWDGFRAIVTVSGGEVSFRSRNDNDLTERFKDVARSAALAIRSSDVVLDGELCALDDGGRSRFSLLQEGGGSGVLVVFDLLELESEPLVDLPLSERRKRLEQLVSAPRRQCSYPRSSTTARRCSSQRASRSWRASWPSWPTRGTGRAPARPTGRS